MIRFKVNRALVASLDWRLFCYTVFLVLAGILVLYSATRTSGSATPGAAWGRQCLSALLGLLVLVVTIVVPYSEWRRYSYLAYGSALLILALMPFLPASREAHGAVRWIRIGPLNFQPSEFAKLTLILVLARALDLPKERKGSLSILVIGLGLAMAPILLVLRQPDLGTAMCLFAPALAMLFLAGARTGHLAILGGLGACLAPLGYFFILKDYQRTRIMTFLSPSHDPLGAGWNVLQSKIAIGSGEMWGKGWLANTQGQLQFLPRHHTDFIFSVLAEEQGFLGTLVILAVFWLWISRIFRISADAKDRFGGLLLVGIGTLFAFQIIVNVSMTMGLLPCTGIPLPFFSYGGSNLLVILWGIGMIQNVYIRRFMFP